MVGAVVPTAFALLGEPQHGRQFVCSDPIAPLPTAWTAWHRRPPCSPACAPPWLGPPCCMAAARRRLAQAVAAAARHASSSARAAGSTAAFESATTSTAAQGALARSNVGRRRRLAAAAIAARAAAHRLALPPPLPPHPTRPLCRLPACPQFPWGKLSLGFAAAGLMTVAEPPSAGCTATAVADSKVRRRPAAPTDCCSRTAGSMEVHLEGC